MNTWIEHDGSGMPVDGETLVNVKFRDGTDDLDYDPIPAKLWGTGNFVSNWAQFGEPCEADIVAYRVVS